MFIDEETLNIYETLNDLKYPKNLIDLSFNFGQIHFTVRKRTKIFNQEYAGFL